MSIDARARRAYHYVRDRRFAPPKFRVVERSPVPTIYYFAWDYNVPSGGIRTIYRHVDTLNAAGLNAAVLHVRRGFRCTWFPNETRTIDVRSMAFGPEDILVVPETGLSMVQRPPSGIKHVIFNQSGHLTWEHDAVGTTRHYLHNPDLLGVMVVSEHSRELLQYAFDRPVHRIYLSIDGDMFYPPEKPNGRVISYMPRRGRSDAETVLHILRARQALSGWTVNALDGLSIDEVARRMRRSTIFLATPYQEGFGLPAAEAMASGNYVTGFHGFGGREFFSTDFSHPVPTGDVQALASAVEKSMAREQEEPGWCWSRGVRAARQVLSEYSPERERTSIVEFFEKFGFGG